MDFELPNNCEEITSKNTTKIVEVNSSDEKLNDDKVSNIKKFFDLANDNVKSATEIFNKCVDMRKKLDRDTRELERKRIEHEQKCSEELEKIKKLKDKIFQKLK